VIKMTLVNDYPTTRLADFITDLSFDDIPNEVVEKMKDCFLDFLRVSIHSSTYDFSKLAYQVGKRVGGDGKCTILVHGDKTTSVNAAFVNGTFAHGIESDDTHVSSVLHPGVTILPSVLAIGEEEHIDGRQLITAAVAGYETMIRIGEAVMPSHMIENGFHTTATIGTFGSAVAVGKLLRLSSKKMSNLLGFAASHVSGLNVFYDWGSMLKGSHGGKAATSGIWPALMADVGMDAPPNILEKRGGFCQVYSNKYDLKKITDRLGEEFKVMNVEFKPHSGSRTLHSAIDAAHNARNLHRIEANNLKAITVGTTNYIVEKYSESIFPYVYKPRDVYTAQQNIPFCIALGLIKGSNHFQDYWQNWKNDNILETAKLVRLIHDPEVEKEFPNGFISKVTFKLNNGEEITEYVKHPKGGPKNPFTRTEFLDLFRKYTLNILPANQIEEIIKTVEELDKIQNVSELLELTCK
jgi:2-methylcitrate dehydratase PrpD